MKHKILYMEVISTNLAEPAIIEWRGQQVQTGIYKYPIEAPIDLEYEDVKNDHVIDRRYHGGFDKACYLYSADHYAFWKSKYSAQEWQWGMFGENLTVKGLNESEIRIGDRFQIGDAEVQVSQPRQPCFKLGVRFGNQQIVDDFWLLPYPGVYVRVLKPGRVYKGDQLVLMNRNQESLSVSEVFSIFRINSEKQDMIQKAIQEPLLAESCRRDLLKLLQ